jgi:type III pantothenate kinase
MLLAIDIGNTQTVIGLFKDDLLVQSWRMVTPIHETSDEIGSIVYSFIKNSEIRPVEIEKISVSCVVPGILPEIEKMSQKYFNLEPFIIDININTGLKISYDYPKEIGADRIANAVAAKELYGCPVIIIDFGTATTLDIISSKCEYLGGVIAPGIEISSEALFKYAAKLSKVDLSWPDTVVGKNTYDCLRSGILYGFLGQAEFLLKKIIEEVRISDKDFNPKTIATGGLSVLMADKAGFIDFHEPDLTLKGLKILIEMNE